MSEPQFSLLCEGRGCVLRERCIRYTSGIHVDHKASGYMWIGSCNEETRPDYLPVARYNS